MFIEELNEELIKMQFDVSLLGLLTSLTDNMKWIKVTLQSLKIVLFYDL